MFLEFREIQMSLVSCFTPGSSLVEEKFKIFVAVSWKLLVHQVGFQLRDSPDSASRGLG